MARRGELIDIDRGVRSIRPADAPERPRLTLRRLLDSLRGGSGSGDAALLAALDSLTKTLAEERRQLSSLQLERTHLQDEREEARVEAARFRAELHAEQARAQHLEVLASTARAEVDRLAPELAAYRGECEVIRVEREELRVEAARLRAELEGERRRAGEVERDLRSELSRLRRPPVLTDLFPGAEPPRRRWRRGG